MNSPLKNPISFIRFPMMASAAFITLSSLSCDKTGDAEDSKRVMSRAAEAPIETRASEDGGASDPLTEPDSLALASGLVLPESYPILSKAAAFIRFFPSGVCTGLFITPQKLLTSAHCVVKLEYDWNALKYVQREVDTVVAGGVTIYQRQSPKPRVKPNPNYTSLYFRDDNFPEILQHSPRTMAGNLLENQALYDVAIIDFTGTPFRVAGGVNQTSDFERIRLPTSGTRTNSELLQISDSWTSNPTKSLMLLGAGLKETCPQNTPNNDCRTGQMRYTYMPKPQPIANLGPTYPAQIEAGIKHDDFVFSISENQKIKGRICPGDSGGPLLQRILVKADPVDPDKITALNWQVIGVTHGAIGFGDDEPLCMDPVDGGGRIQKFTRTDNPAVGAWLKCEVDGKSNCAAGASADMRYASTYRDYIKGNPLFFYNNDSIDSATGKVRVFIDASNKLVAQCRSSKKILWSAPQSTTSSGPKMIAMGYNKQAGGLLVKLTSVPGDWYRLGTGYSTQITRNNRFTDGPENVPGDFAFGKMSGLGYDGSVIMQVTDRGVYFRASPNNNSAAWGTTKVIYGVSFKTSCK